MSSKFLLFLMFFLSGVAGLGYEIVWTKMFVVGLGHEMPSMLAVIASFFGGISVGAVVMDRVVSRSAVPARWYVACELTIGIWALVTVLLLPEINSYLPSLIGVEPEPAVQWFWSVIIPFIVLLPATFAMGATFPVMERMLVRQTRTGKVVGGVYALNTAGAMTGTLVSTYFLIPTIGFTKSLYLFASLNLLCCLLAYLGPVRVENRSSSKVRPPVPAREPALTRVYLTLFFAGVLGIGYEVLGIRVMSQVLENTVYTFASVLSAYLLATAIGASLYQRFLVGRAFIPVYTSLLHLLSISCLLGIFLLSNGREIHSFLGGLTGRGVIGAIGAELSLAVVIFLVPAALMGALFSHLAQAARAEKGGVGYAFGINTLGSACAPVVFVVFLLPLIGSKWSIVLVAAGYLLLVPGVINKTLQVASVGLSAAVVALLPANLNLVTLPEGGKLVDYREGVMASVSIVEGSDGERLLKVNNRFAMGSSAGVFPESRMAHLPLLMHPQPENALFLGVGTGITATAAATHKNLTVTAVEIIPEVLELVDNFKPSWAGSAPQFLAADARRYVRAVEENYDVIVADLFHAARDGAGMLYTIEHYQAIMQRLRSDGVFVQWLPVHQLDIESLRLIVRSFNLVFPESSAIMAHYNIETPLLGLVGSNHELEFNAGEFQERLKSGPERVVARQAGISGVMDVFGVLVGSREDLQRFSEHSDYNSDDLPHVMYQAPYFAYDKQQPAHARLVYLLERWRPDIDKLFPGNTDKSFTTSLKQYVAARNLFLKAQVQLEQRRLEEGVDLLVESYKTSREFRTTRFVLQQIHRDLRTTRPDYAKSILKRLGN